MSNTVIKVENLGKQYHLGQVGTGTISNDINRWWHRIRGKEDPYLKIGETNDRSIKGDSDLVWALKDISFEIKQGEVLGIIGKNGAGKSTLLKILSRVTGPTVGDIKVKGRIASLLEVGTGFHPDLSGRENIFLNGAILGMSKREIKTKFDEIVDFSGVERYIDTPVKRYSSGMYVRLAFAVAAHLESEILIIDEVLAVGDAEFQKKCLGKMGDVSKQDGKTILFVSHNILLIQSLCQKAILLQNGLMLENGEVNDVVASYNLKKEFDKCVWEGRQGDEKITILKTSVNDNISGKPLQTSEKITIKITVEVSKKIEIIDFTFHLHSFFNYPVLMGVFNDFNDMKGIDIGLYELVFEIPPYTLATGKYGVIFKIGYPYIKKIETSICELNFELVSDSEFGNRYLANNSPEYNSIVRSNYFKELIKLS